MRPLYSDGEQRFALRVLADGDAVHFELAQLDLHPGCMVDGFHHGVDGSLGDLIVDHDTAVGVCERGSSLAPVV